MGLDMYLTATRSFHPKEYKPKKEQAMHKKLRKMFPEIKDTGNLDTATVQFEVGYWRKANAIHAWFVREVQDGDDNCASHYVNREKLKELLDICELALKTKDTNLLKTQEGFFFGSTEYDDWYWEDIKHTIKVLKYCLSLPEEWYFEYRSSW